MMFKIFTFLEILKNVIFFMMFKIFTFLEILKKCYFFYDV